MSLRSSLLLSVVLAAGLTLMVVRFVDLRLLQDTLASVSVPWLIAAYAALLLYQVFRAIRIRLLVATAINQLGLTLTLCVQGGLNTLLPSGLGEVVLIYLLRKVHGIRVHLGAAAVIFARMLDVALFVVFFFLLVLAVDTNAPQPVYWVMYGLGAGVIAVFSVTLVARKLDRGSNHEVGGQSTHARIWRWSRSHVEALADGFRIAQRPSALLGIVLSSGAMWVLMYLVMLFVVYALGFSLPLLDVFWVYLLFFPVNMLPVKGFAGIGTHHVTWFVALRITGVNEIDAATLAFGSHLLMLSLVIAVAAPAMLVLLTRDVLKSQRAGLEKRNAG